MKKRSDKERHQKERRQEAPLNKQLSEWERTHPNGHAGHPYN